MPLGPEKTIQHPNRHLFPQLIDEFHVPILLIIGIVLLDTILGYCEKLIRATCVNKTKTITHI